MERILGYFLFTLLGDGVLGSKFGHTESLRLLSETATLIDGGQLPDPWVGNYASLWFDQVQRNNIQPSDGLLSIRLKPNSVGGQYWLEWLDSANGNILYWGEGMVYDNVLIGAYWGSAINVALPTPR